MARIAWTALLALGLLASPPGHAADRIAAGPLQWLDDRGESLPAEELFEVCWIRGLDRDCDRVSGDLLPDRLPAFDVLQVDSPGHGPLSLRSRDLQPADDGYRIRMPRKAWLTVKNLPAESVKLSLYPQQDPATPRPVFRVAPLNGPVVRIPAGAFVASLSAQGSAPHLALLDVGPGGRITLAYQRRPGWSLMLRASDRQTGLPVADVRVEVVPAAGYSVSGTVGNSWKSETGAHGLVIFSGLTEPIVEARLRHPGFLPLDHAGLSSTRGTFAFEEALLPKGGGVSVSVTLDGEAVRDAECSLLRYRREGSGSQAPPEEIWADRSTEDGLCPAERLREGTYWLRVRPPKRLLEDSPSRSAHVDRVLQVLEGQTTREEVALEPTQVAGVVRLGEKPAAGYEVMVLDPENKIRNSSSEDSLVAVKTDADGRYELILWTTGEFWMIASNSAGAPGTVKTVRLEGDTRTVDFHLAPHEIRGRVVDGDGSPMDKASVQLKWNDSSLRMASTDVTGNFSLPVEKEGWAELIAHKEGYESSDPALVEVGPGFEPSSVVLTVARRPKIVVRLLTPDGRSVLAGWASTYRLEVHEPVRVGMAAPDAEGRLRLPVAPGHPHRLFFGGPNCPLGARSIDSLPAPGTPLDVVCAAAPANLQVTLTDPQGAPREGLGVLLAQGKVVYPREVVTTHLAQLGLPATTNGSGLLSLVALEPGEYRLYLADVTSPFNVLVGASRGFLTQVTLEPWTTRAAEVRFEMDFTH